VLHDDSDDLLRVVSQESVDYSDKSGWYLDLRPPLPEEAEGERVVSAPLLRHGHVIFTTLIPLADPCAAGGTSWIMELDALSGGRTDSSVFDINGDGKVDSDDQVTVTIDGEEVVVTGIKSTVGIVKTPAVIADGEIEYKYTGGSEGGIAVIREKGSESDLIGRRSWRQLQ
jgi:type IV pilus assembly protein PilY1